MSRVWVLCPNQQSGHLVESSWSLIPRHPAKDRLVYVPTSQEHYVRYYEHEQEFCRTSSKNAQRSHRHNALSFASLCYYDFAHRPFMYRAIPLSMTYITLLNAGISVCANQKLNTNFGPVMSSFGTSPLKNAVGPSCLAMLLIILNPDCASSKLRFWIRVLTTSRGAETIREAEAPAMEATKF